MMNLDLQLRLAGGAIATVLALSAGMAVGAPQSTDQQRCLNDLTKAGTKVVRQQGKQNWACLRNKSRGKLDKLADPGETETAQDCLTNDVGGKVAKKQSKTTLKDGQRCGGSDTPDFAYAGAAAINAAASAQSIDVVTAIFGGDFDSAIVDYDIDRDGAKCQEEVLKGANRIVDDMWKVSRLGVKTGLKGRNRRAGADPDLAVHSSDNLQSEVLAQSLDDTKGKIQGEVDRLLAKAIQRCTTATTPLGTMFPGDCVASADIAELVDCVAGIARGRFYRSVEGFYSMSVECEMTDDGTLNESCTSAAQKAHVLNRTAYGPDAYTISRIDTLGLAGYIAEQLDPTSIDDSAVDTELAATYPALSLNVVDARDCYPKGGGGTCPGHEGGAKGDVFKQMEESEIYRAVASKRQLEAVLVDFWFNHYNVAGSTGQQKWNTPSYLRDSIRPYILGDFEESVVRMTRGPAMLDYLDQRQNVVGTPPGSGYNENFSRELLELHTLGVTGPYDEDDVKEAARALTGWTNEWNNAANFEPGYPGFKYLDGDHDYLGAKEVLGETINIPLDGEQEGFEVIRLASEDPAAAEFLCGKLIRRFVADDPPFALLEECTATFIANQGASDQLKQVMLTIFGSPEFLVFPEYQQAKVKRPVHFIASMMRAVGADPDPTITDYKDLRKDLDDLGERIRNAGPPTGYPDTSIFWASPGGLVQRLNLSEDTAIDAASGWGVSGAQPTGDIVDDVAAQLLPVAGISTTARDAAIAYVDSLSATDDEKVEQAAAFLLTMREFLNH